MFSTANFSKIPVFAFRLFFFAHCLSLTLFRTLWNECVGVLIRAEKWAKRKWQRFGNENQIRKKNWNENDLDSIPCSYFHFLVEFSIIFCGSHFLTHSPILKCISVWFPHFSFGPKNRLMFQLVFIFLFEVTGPIMWLFSRLFLSFQMENSCSWKPFFFWITLFWCSYLFITGGAKW